MFSQGSQLAQIRVSASASTAVTTTLRTEVTRIFVCNTSSSIATFSIYHDEDGTTYDETTALFFGATIEANTTVDIISDTLGAGIMMMRGASLGINSDTDNALTFSIYGVTEDVAPR